jgi:hypothetical protein
MLETTPQTTPNPTGADQNNPNTNPNAWGQDDGGEDDDEDDDEGGQKTPKPITQDDFKKYKSDVERGVQKLMETHRKDAELKDAVLDGISQITQDQEKMIDLYKSNPAAAKVILDKYYGNISIEDFQTEYLGYDKPKVRTQVDEDAIIKKHEEKKQGEQMSTRFDTWTTELATAWLSDEDIASIKEEYDDIIGRRVVDEAKQKKIFKSVYYSVMGKSLEDTNTAKAAKQTAAGGAGGSSKEPGKWKDPYADPSIKFLIDQGILSAPKKA